MQEHEIHGQQYWFTSQEDMAAQAAAGQFLETCEQVNDGQHVTYGTSLATVRQIGASGGRPNTLPVQCVLSLLLRIFCVNFVFCEFHQMCHMRLCVCAGCSM
jgi:guanylate kinase